MHTTTIQVCYYQYAIINTNGMNVDDEVEVDRILAQTDILVPGSSPELLGAVGLPQYTLYAQRGWHSKRRETAECEKAAVTREHHTHIVFLLYDLSGMKDCNT